MNAISNRQIPELTYANPAEPAYKQAVIRLLERANGQRKLQRLYEEFANEPRNGKSYWEAALDKLNITVDYDAAQLLKIPQDGPVVFVANHPFGMTDGLILCRFAQQCRPEFKIFIYDIFCKEPEVDQFLLPVNFDETKDGMAITMNTKREAIRILKEGGMILIFPAGEISTANRMFEKAVDAEWKIFTAKMVHMTQATVVPIFFHGQNSPAFHFASKFGPTIRLSMIIREVRKNIGQTFKVDIGDPIPYTTLAPIKKRKDLLAHLRESVYALESSNK